MLQPKDFELKRVPVPTFTDDEVLFKGARIPSTATEVLMHECLRYSRVLRYAPST